MLHDSCVILRSTYIYVVIVNIKISKNRLLEGGDTFISVATLPKE